MGGKGGWRIAGWGWVREAVGGELADIGRQEGCWGQGSGAVAREDGLRGRGWGGPPHNVDSFRVARDPLGTAA